MTFFFWFLGFSALALSVVLMVAYFRLHRFHEPNVILVMYVCHLLMQMGTATVLMFDPDAIVAVNYFIACAVAALLIPVGGLIGGALVPAKTHDSMRFRMAPPASDLETRRATWWFFLLLLSVCSLLLVVYISHTGPTPLRELVLRLDDAASLQLARRDASPGNLGALFGMIQRFFIPVLFLMALMGLGYFRSRLAKLFCLAAIGISLLYNAWAADKTPVVMLFLLAFVIVLLRKNEASRPPWTNQIQNARRWLRKRRWRVLTIAIVFASLAVGYAVFIFLFKPAAEHGLGYIFQHILLRIVYKPAMNSYYAIEAFTHTFDYTWFTDIRRLAGLFGWDYVHLSREIALYKGQTEFTSAPPTAIGNFYAQGGWLVLVLGVLGAATVFKIVENVLYRVRMKTIVHLALYALLLYGAFRFSWANFHTILVTETIFPLLITLGLWRLFLGTYPSPRKKQSGPSPAQAG